MTKRGHKQKKTANRTEQETNILKRDFLDLYKQDGMSTNQAAKQLDFGRTMMYKWKETDPEFAEEYERIKLSKVSEEADAWIKRHGKDEENKKKFLERYKDPKASVAGIINSMGKNVDKQSFTYWRQTDPEFVEKIEEIQEQKSPRHAKGMQKRKATWRKEVVKKQNHFLEVYRNTLFNITKTCETLDIPRTTVMDWVRKDPDFKTLLDGIDEERKDFLEHAAMKKIQDGDTIMTIFALKCQAADRGWTEKTQDRKLTVEIKHDKATLDAVARGAQLDRGKYYEKLGLEAPKEQEQIPEIIEAEYENVE